MKYTTIVCDLCGLKVTVPFGTKMPEGWVTANASIGAKKWEIPEVHPACAEQLVKSIQETVDKAKAGALVADPATPTPTTPATPATPNPPSTPATPATPANPGGKKP